MTYFILKYLHVMGAVILLGTGAGIAFFMLMAHVTGKAATIAAVARIVVIADFVFTATAVVAQPITGLMLTWHAGYSVTDAWIFWSIVLLRRHRRVLAAGGLDADADARSRAAGRDRRR